MHALQSHVTTEDRPQLDAVEALLVETFGMRLLGYLCGVDEARIVSRIEDRRALPTGAEAVLTRDLVLLAQMVAARLAESPQLPRGYAIDLARTLPGRSIGMGTALRLSAGGEVPENLVHDPTTDPVKAQVGRMAIDAYPQLLLPRGKFDFGPVLAPSLFNHPAEQALQTAISADPALRRLFSEQDGTIGRCGYMYNSLGRGGSYQDVMFSSMVITSAWDALAMTHHHPNLPDLIEQCYRNVDAVRAALLGQPATIQGRIVFTGFRTGDQAVRTPWGTLRPMTDWERALAPPSLAGAVTGNDPDGGQVTVSYSGEMVLEAELPYAVLVSAPPGDNVFRTWPKIDGADTVRRIIEGVQLALLLSTERPEGQWAAARLSWSWSGDPLGHGSNLGWSDIRRGVGFMPAELTAEECQLVGEWAHHIEDRWTPRIDIAVRRLLRAVNERTDMADRLVDAVIVWENLFGTSEGEPTLRISSSLAWLLADDPAQREELQRKCRSLYRDRSRIVHGAAQDESALAESANAALRVARDALRVMFRERPELIALPDGAARSLRLIMGG
jgi:hypothetical protein